MRVSLKLRLRHDFWLKNEKYHILRHLLVYLELQE